MNDSKNTTGKFFRFTVGKVVYFIGDNAPYMILEVPVKEETFLFKLQVNKSYKTFFESPEQFYCQIDYRRTFFL